MTRYKSSHSALHNDKLWGCPEYVLEPRLQDGNKLPKWMPSYRRDKYLVAYPLYSSTVGLVRNLQTGNISPQFHLVFDDYFENFRVGEDQEPPVWSELITFKSFKSAYDDDGYVPNLSFGCFFYRIYGSQKETVIPETLQYTSSGGRVASRSRIKIP